MTPQEIYDEINYLKENPKTGNAIFDEVIALYYADKEEDAVQHIKEVYDCEEELARQTFDIFKSRISKPTPLMKTEAAAYFGGLYEKNVPKCPTCGSTNIKKISSMSKAVGMLTLGILDADIHRTFYCKNCGYRW